MITVVFLHSHDHFIPGKQAKHQFSSAHFIAAEIYETLSKDLNVSVHYFDIRQIKEWRKIKADFLITLVDNLKLSTWFFKPGKVVLIAVNKHPLARLKNLVIAKQKKLPQSALSGHDGIYEQILPLKKIDYLICIGNDPTFDSYKRYFDRLRIIQTHYNSNNFENKDNLNLQIQSNVQRNAILVTMSSIGFRKNYDFINKLVQSSDTTLALYHIYLVGSPANAYWESIIEANMKSPNFTYLGYINNLNAKSKNFYSILPRVKLALVPTLEEGLPGAMLDLINSGILCLHNRDNSGIDNTKDILHSDFLSIESVITQMDFLMKLDQESYLKLQQEQRQDLRRMFEKKHTFTEAVKFTLYDTGFTKGYTRINFWRTYLDFFKVPFIKYPSVFLRRFYRDVLIYSKNKVYLIFK